jgi:hypothetical protein
MNEWMDKCVGEWVNEGAGGCVDEWVGRRNNE